MRRAIVRWGDGRYIRVGIDHRSDGIVVYSMGKSWNETIYDDEGRPIGWSALKHAEWEGHPSPWTDWFRHPIMRFRAWINPLKPMSGPSRD